MRSGAVFIDRFTAGLDDLTGKQQADPIAVLRVLKERGRFSVFEASDNPIIARTMTRMMHGGCITLRDGVKTEHGKLLENIGGAYPWTQVRLTKEAEKLLKEHQPGE